MNLTLDEAGIEDNSDIETEEAGAHPLPYSFYRTRIGSPSINRRSFTDEEIDRFIRKFHFHFPRPQGYKAFFILNSTEHEISTAHKN